jgi:thiol-disulfide isomerase/thioredoxin
MRRLAVLAVLLALTAGCGASGSQPKSPAPSFGGSGFAACPAASGSATGKLSRVQPLTCMDGSGKQISLGAPTGKPMVLNLWASWCPPCGKELPAFVQFAASAGNQVTVVGVDTGDSATNAVPAAKDYDVRYANVYDRGETVRKALGVSALPATAFVTASGQVAYVYHGTPLTKTTLTGLVSKHLGVTLE